VCNPVVTVPEGDDRHLDDGDEGCLSFPGAFVPCPRPDHAAVEGQDLEGEPVRYSGDGLLARCLQHETDHCRGTVFGDRLNRRAKKRLAKQHDDAVADFPPGWPASGG
jgi:peptide deformylase